MLEIIDKLLLFLSCSIVYLQGIDDPFALVPMTILISFSSLCTYFENRKFNLLIILVYALLCIYFPHLLLYLPVILYELFQTKDWVYGALYIIPITMHVSKYDTSVILFIGFFMILSYFVKYKTFRVKKLTAEYYTYRDNAKELELLLEDKNLRLLEKQDYEINMATLNERNRISKEIHDNIGHMLSRALLQIGALLTISKEKDTKDGLLLLKDSISQGMDSIRSSIHNMHDASIDLYARVDALVKGFSFCSISLDYYIKTPPSLKLKYCIIATVKEALANVMKHSNATKVFIAITEHPIMYQLVISDNGVLSSSKAKALERLDMNIYENDGMGLRNIVERIRGFDGIIHISADNGFKLFITVPINKAKEI